jgi:hypothetical protein
MSQQSYYDSTNMYGSLPPERDLTDEELEKTRSFKKFIVTSGSCGVIGDTPIFFKVNELVHVYPIKDVYKIFPMFRDTLLVWTSKGWSKILRFHKVKKDSTEELCKLVNNKNILYAMGDTKIKLRNASYLDNYTFVGALCMHGRSGLDDKLFIKDSPMSRIIDQKHLKLDQLIDPMDYTECDMCRKPVNYTIHWHCTECPDFDLCLKCHEKNPEHIYHKKSHNMQFIITNRNTAIINYDVGGKELDIEKAKIILESYGVINSHMARSYNSFENFIKMQTAMVLGRLSNTDVKLKIFNGFIVSINQLFGYRSFKKDYVDNKDMINDAKNLDPEIKTWKKSYDSYMKHLKKYFSKNFIRKSLSYSPNSKENIVDKLYKKDKVFGRSPTIRFHTKNDRIYHIETETGDYQAGVGGLIILSQ